MATLLSQQGQGHRYRQALAASPQRWVWPAKDRTSGGRTAQPLNCLGVGQGVKVPGLTSHLFYQVELPAEITVLLLMTSIYTVTGKKIHIWSKIERNLTLKYRLDISSGLKLTHGPACNP